jgi:hypothetical protein
VLVVLSSLISESLVPIEDWISTVSYLSVICFEDAPDYSQQESYYQMHDTIDSICMACTSRCHVMSLVDGGILDYWKRVESNSAKEACSGMYEVISHLISIDRRLSLLIPFQFD